MPKHMDNRCINASCPIHREHEAHRPAIVRGRFDTRAGARFNPTKWDSIQLAKFSKS